MPVTKSRTELSVAGQARLPVCALNRTSQLLRRRKPTNGSPNCISGRCTKGYAELQPRHCLRISVDDWLLRVCQFGALLPGCEPYIRNGPVTRTPGGATVTRSTQPGPNAAKSMSRTCGTAPMHICAMSPLGETCRCACGVG